MSNDWLKQNFEKRIMIIKGMSTAGILAIVLWAVEAFKTWDFTPTAGIKETVITLIGAGAFGLLIMFRNALKNYWGIDLGPWFGVLLVCFAFTGCASTMPALAGKTDLTTEFRDVVVGENQDTYYKQTIKAPAGVELDNIASMGYQWKDGEGAINVNNQAAADTTYQADALVQVNAQQMDLIKAMMDQIVSLAGIASPLIGQNLGNRATQQQNDAANKAALQAQVIQLLKDPAVLGALQNIGAARAQYVPKMELLLPE